MTSDDLKKIFLGPTLFRLDTILSPRLVPVLYATGLAALLLWAITHLFATFGRNFGDGLWGLLEIVVFGLLGLVVLRITCEMMLVFFKAHESAARAVGLSRISTSLLEEVKEAINDIADEEDVRESPLPVRQPSTAADAGTRSSGRSAIKRTARRSPPAGPASKPPAPDAP